MIDSKTAAKLEIAQQKADAALVSTSNENETAEILKTKKIEQQKKIAAELEV